MVILNDFFGVETSLDEMKIYDYRSDWRRLTGFLSDIRLTNDRVQNRIGTVANRENERMIYGIKEKQPRDDYSTFCCLFFVCLRE